MMRWRGKLGTLLKYSGVIFGLGHRKPLMVLNKGHVLQVKEGFVPQPPQLKVAILGEVDTQRTFKPQLRRSHCRMPVSLPGPAARTFCRKTL